MLIEITAFYSFIVHHSERERASEQARERERGVAVAASALSVTVRSLRSGIAAACGEGDI